MVDLATWLATWFLGFMSGVAISFMIWIQYEARKED